MARILQDGFETEGKEFDTAYQIAKVVRKMDVADFVFNSRGSSSSMEYKSGVCAPRGGYGTKGFSMVVNFDTQYNGSCALKYDLTKYSNDTSELFYRVWVNPHLVGTNISANYNRLVALALTNIDFENRVNSDTYKYDEFVSLCHCLLSIEIKDATSYYLNCYCNNVLVYTYDCLYYNQWVKLDVRYKVGDANNGIFQLRINDKLITTFNGATGNSNPNLMYIGKPSSNTYCYGQIDVDDVAINDTTGNVNNSWCGNGSIIGMVPSANGSKSMFTPGVEGTQNFENVDEIISDGDTTYNSSYALNDIDTFKFIIPEELGIPVNGTINAISVSTSAKYVEQPTAIGHIVSDGTNDVLINQHDLSNDYQSQSSIVQEKSDGTKYKVSDIEGLEFGYKTLEITQAQEE